MATKSLYLNKVERNQEQGSKPSMEAAPFDFTPLLPAGLPAAAAKWTGLAEFNARAGRLPPAVWRAVHKDIVLCVNFSLRN
jgi:hypothetical protein